MIILLEIVKHTGESYIESSSSFLRVFFLLGIKFPSDRADFLVEMFIFVKPGAFQFIQKRSNSGKQMK